MASHMASHAQNKKQSLTTKAIMPKPHFSNSEINPNVPQLISNGKHRSDLTDTVEILQYHEDDNGLNLMSPNLYSSGLSSANHDALAQYLDLSSASLTTPLSNFFLTQQSNDRHAISTPTSPSQYLNYPDFQFTPNRSQGVMMSPSSQFTQSHPHKLTKAQKAALASINDPAYSPNSPSQSDEARRQMHIECEKKRRNQIKNGFEELRMEIPGLMHKKVSKAVLLTKAIEFVRMVKHERDVLALEVERLRSQQNN